MIGGHLSFVGIEGKVRYRGTPIETALLVSISPHLACAERPEGVHPPVVQPVLAGVPEDWPTLLGYNSLTSKSTTQIVTRCDADPLLVGSHGVGRSAAFVSDYAPRWRPPDSMGWPSCNHP